MKILIIPDSFKGSASNVEVASRMVEGVRKIMPQAQCRSMPLADGGEGSLEAIQLSLGGQMMALSALDPFLKPIPGAYLKIGEIAFVELAQVSGLQLLTESERCAGQTSTKGTGMIMSEAMTHVQELILCIGGSATNDAGCGIAHALGYRFLDHTGKEFLPVGDTLANLAEIIAPAFLPSIPIRVLCDVRNPLTGPEGATYTYGPQKGASKHDLDRLENGMIHFRNLIKEWKSIDLDKIEGAGAAGGVGGGMVAFFDATIESGVQYLIRKLKVEEAIKDCDLIFTGEGKIDFQTRHGKLISGITEYARKHDKPVIAICGALNLTVEETTLLGLTAAFSIIPQVLTEQAAFENTGNLIVETTAQIMKVINRFKDG